MSETFQIGRRKFTAREIVSLVEKSPLRTQLLREAIVKQAIAPITYTSKELDRTYQQLYLEKQLCESDPQTWQQLYGATPRQLRAIAIQTLKLEKFKEISWGGQIHAYFLTRQEQLDEVTYSLIRTADEAVAQELYFRIQEGEQSFAEVARQYSQGAEAAAGGLVGPVRVNALPPQLAGRLRSSQPGQLFPPFHLEGWFAIARLEQLLPAQLNERMRQQLLEELFENWLKETIAREIEAAGLEKAYESSTVVPPEHLEIQHPEAIAVNAIHQEADMQPEPQEHLVPSEAAPELPESSPPTSPPSPVRQTQKSPWRRGTVLMGVALLCAVAAAIGSYSYQTLESLLWPEPPAPVTHADAFRQAVNKATEAATLTQEAQTAEEWDFVASHWQQAIALMKAVPNDGQNYAIAQGKIVEYQRYLDYAQQKAAQLTPESN
jgi:parvulin-like peptidyl-prolyl isomerase